MKYIFRGNIIFHYDPDAHYDKVIQPTISGYRIDCLRASKSVFDYNV